MVFEGPLLVGAVALVTIFGVSIFVFAFDPIIPREKKFAVFVLFVLTVIVPIALTWFFVFSGYVKSTLDDFRIMVVLLFFSLFGMITTGGLTLNHLLVRILGWLKDAMEKRWKGKSVFVEPDPSLVKPFVPDWAKEKK